MEDSPIFKNISAQKVRVFAFDATTNLPKTGDAANLTAYLSKDYGAVTVLGDTSATEEDATNAKGWYLFDVTQTESNFDVGNFTAKSSTANVVVIGERVTTFPAAFGLVGGAAGGFLIAGANAALTSFTAGMVISNAGGDALQLTSSGSNGNALAAAANGTGAGIKTTGGATGNGIQAIGGATSGSAIKASGTAGNAIALELAGQGSAAGLSATGGATGVGIAAVGGGTSGDGVKVTTTSGHGINLAPVGTSMHGLLATGGNGGTSDGIKAVAGTGGVPIRGDLTGNITGNLSGSAGSVTGAVGSVTGAVGSVTGAVGSVTGNVGGNVVGSVASVTARVTANTDQLAGQTVAAAAGVTFPTSVASPTNITAGTITAVAAGGINASDKTGYRLSATGLTDVRDIQLLEVYATDGSAPTLNQAIMQIQQFLTERAIVGTTLTVKGLDGSTSKMTFTLDSATSPTTITRAT